MHTVPLSLLSLEDRAVPSTVKFDFGTGYSPVAAGYSPVTEATTYNPTRGYGWTAGAIYSDDRGTADAATRDFNFSADATFAAAVDNGDYLVTLTLGDSGGYQHDSQGVYLEGVQVDSVSTVAGQIVTKSYAVTVADSQLTFRLADLGGADPYAVVESMVVTPVGAASPPTAPTTKPTTLSPTTSRFDFGSSNSPVAVGYSPVTNSTVYSPSRGFGWQSGVIYADDRGGANAATRDFNFTADGTFAADVANGDYDVTVTIGDAGGYRHDRQALFLEGSQVDSVDTVAGQVVAKTYSVEVSDGQLTLRLQDFGGADPYCVIESLTVMPAGIATPTPTPPPQSQFSITVRSTGLSASQQAIFQQAADRWAQVIVGDFPDRDWYGVPVDDLLIDASVEDIDGVGGVAGGTGMLALRMDNYLPYYAQMAFDSADLNWLEASGQLLAVVEHEMGHALGIGTVWQYQGLITGRGGSTPLFTGPRATAEYNARFGTNASGVPVESTGGPGTAYAHWSEAVFGSELMTGWLNSGSTPLSRVTIAALADMGYAVNLDAADPF